MAAKTPRAAAEKALSGYGATALEAIREGADSKKKAQREFCKGQLSRLQKAASKSSSEADFDGEAIRKAFRYCEEPTASAFVNEHGGKAVGLLEEVLVEHDDTQALWDLARRLDANKDNCRAVIGLLCRMNLSKSIRNEVGRRLESLFGKAKTASVMLERLEAGLAMGLELEFTHFILEHRPLESPDLVLKGLQSDSKVTRELAIQAAAKHQNLVGEIDKVLSIGDLIGLLKNSRQTTRKAAAAALAQLTAFELEKYRQDIEEALAEETDSDVAFELEEIVDAL